MFSFSSSVNRRGESLPYDPAAVPECSWSRRRDKHHVAEIVIHFQVVVVNATFCSGSSTSSSAEAGSPACQKTFCRSHRAGTAGFSRPFRHFLDQFTRHRTDVRTAVTRISASSRTPPSAIRTYLRPWLWQWTDQERFYLPPAALPGEDRSFDFVDTALNRKILKDRSFTRSRP